MKSDRIKICLVWMDGEKKRIEVFFFFREISRFECCKGFA